MNLKKAIFKVFSVNFLQMVSNLIIGFIVPAVLSIEGYADLKTYSLYISYIGFFHLGFVDGLYIKYGGKSINEIDKGILKGEHHFLIIFQIIISIFLFICGMITKNIVLLLFSITIIPIMLQAFHRYLNQAIGNFDRYSKIMYIYTIIYTLSNIVLAIIFRSKHYQLYCLTTTIAYLISVIIYEFKFLIEYKCQKANINKDILKNIKVGFLVMLGNLAVVALFGIDKWFIKLFFSTKDFAYYSFAVSMLNIINTLVNAISITFYNYLFSNNCIEKIDKLKKYLMTLGGAASIGYFALAFIVNYFIEKYIPSLGIIAITFAVFPYMILINALYVNLYKVNKNEKKYFKVVVFILIISIVYNIIAVLLFRNTTSIAFATILTLITWVVYSTHDLDNVTSDKEMYIYTFLLTAAFLICAHYFNWLIGGILYCIIYVILTYITNREVLTDLKDTIKGIFKSRNQVNKNRV